MGIKQSKGKLTLSLPLEDYIIEKTKLEDCELLLIQLNLLAYRDRSPISFPQRDRWLDN